MKHEYGKPETWPENRIPAHEERYCDWPSPCDCDGGSACTRPLRDAVDTSWITYEPEPPLRTKILLAAPHVALILLFVALGVTSVVLWAGQLP